MKKVFLAALLAVFTSTAFAQLITGKSTGYVQEEKWGWNTFSFEYIATNFSTKIDGTVNGIYVSAEDSYTTSGFGFTYMRAISLTRNHKVPLYLEPGIGMEFYIGGNNSGNLKMLTTKIPLNLIYDISFPNSRIHIDPYLGLRFRGNIYGTDEGYSYKKQRVIDDREVFSEDHMGKDAVFTHFQVGWQIGCKFRFSKFYLQLGWGTDFNRLISKNKTSTSQFQSAIGVAF
jgi:hypothetical protein